VNDIEIYFVTTLYIKNGRIERSRCVGFYPDIENANLCITQNWGDIHENGYYNYAVIECFGIGLYPHAKKEVWYRWVSYSSKAPGDPGYNKKYPDGEFKTVDKPEKFKSCPTLKPLLCSVIYWNR
jgi:hypothetical protein